MHLSGLFIYPVKSLRGCAVRQARVDALGLAGDRRFLVISESGQFLTQRTLPPMAQVSTALTSDALVLSADAHGQISVPLVTPPGEPPRRHVVTVWKSEGLVVDDCGEPAAQWLSDFLGTGCRLVRIGDRFQRPVLKAAGRPGDTFAFADSVPFLVISEASLADLNRRLAAAGHAEAPMARFRPNLVIAGAAPFAEDTWPTVQVGEIVLRAAGPCARCIVVNTDPLTGARAPEPLHLLSTYRRDPSDSTRINFGQNFIHETKSGALRLGDSVSFSPTS